MATPVLGTLTAFNAEVEPIKAYLERVDLYFTANSVAAAKRVPALLSAIGPATYSLLSNIFAPEAPREKSLDEITATLKKHFEPTRSVIAERFHFHRRNQTANETIADYLAALRQAALHCDFGDFLDDALRDRFVGGLRTEAMQKRLLAETKLTLTNAVSIAQGMEAADRNARSFKGTDPAIRALSHYKGGNKHPCSRCGKTTHTPAECRFKDAECHACGKKGHIAPVCRSKPKTQTKGKSFSKRNYGTHMVQEHDDSDSEEFHMFQFKESRPSPIQVSVKVEGKPLNMEVDTGAAVSIISEATRKAKFDHLKLRKSRIILKTYTDESMQVTGQLNVHVQYGSQTEPLILVVVAGNGPSLLGRNWLKYIQLDWHQIAMVAKQSEGLDALLRKHDSIFKDELGTVKPHKATLHVKPETTLDAASMFNISQVQSLPVTLQEIQDETIRDPILKQVSTYVAKGWPTNVPDNIKPYQSRQNEIGLESQCLMWGVRVIVPDSLQPRILESLHDTHPGITRMKAIARSYFWWNGIDKAIENLAKSCISCQEQKSNPPVAPLHPWIWPTSPWKRIHIDFAGPFLNKTFLIVVDAHSKWPEVIQMPSTTSSKTIDVLRSLFARYGLPEQVVSDNGPQFTSDEFAQFMSINGVKHIRTAPYHPSSNGQAERFVQTFKRAMKAGETDEPSLSKRLTQFLLTYRTTPHATTNATPSELFLQRKVRTRFDLLKPDVQSSVHQKQKQQKEYHDQHAKARSFATGQLVMIRDFLSNRNWLAGTIASQRGPVSYEVQLDDGRIMRRHVDHIRTRLPPKEPAAGLQPRDDTADFELFESPSPTQEDPKDSPPTPRYPSRDRRPPDRFMNLYS